MLRWQETRKYLKVKYKLNTYIWLLFENSNFIPNMKSRKWLQKKIQRHSVC